MPERVEDAPHAIERQIDPLRMEPDKPRDDGVVGGHGSCHSGAPTRLRLLRELPRGWSPPKRASAEVEGANPESITPIRDVLSTRLWLRLQALAPSLGSSRLLRL